MELRNISMRHWGASSSIDSRGSNTQKLSSHMRASRCQRSTVPNISYDYSVSLIHGSFQFVFGLMEPPLVAVRLPELLAEAGIDEEGRQYIKEKAESILAY